MSSDTIKKMKRLMGKAIHNYSMTNEGDNILVSVSGGKDSMSLLWLLRERLGWLPIDYKITAVYVDPGFCPESAELMQKYFIEQGFDYRIILDDFGPFAHSSDNRENPCFLCSKFRRKKVFDLADELQCNKIALGHNKNDFIETLFLNIFYGGSISTLMPVQNFFNETISVIRPLYMLEEQTIKEYSKLMDFSLVDNNCPTAGCSKRKEIKNMLKHLYKTNKKIEGNIFHAIHNVKSNYMP